MKTICLALLGGLLRNPSEGKSHPFPGERTSWMPAAKTSPGGEGRRVV